MRSTRLLVLPLLIAACGETHGSSPVTAPPAPAPDAGLVEHPTTDGGVPDAGTPDAGVDVPDAGMGDDGGCPYALPPVDSIGVVIHNKVGDRYVIDSTAKTCDRTFCAMQNRVCCPMAPEGTPYRVACENLAMGVASDGVAGPEWSIVGSGSVMRHPTNPYLAFAYYPGKVRACVPKQPTVCGEVELPPP